MKGVGHNVICASDGEEGLRLARERKPDLVVLDSAGRKVLRAVRKDPETAPIPVMVLTSLPQCNQEKLLGESAAAYFEKSLLIVDKGSGPFVEAVERLLAKGAKAKAAAI